MARVFDKIDAENKKNNLESLQVMQDMGIQFVKPSAKERQEWKRLAAAAIERLEKENLVDSTSVSKLDSMLKSFRSQ